MCQQTQPRWYTFCPLFGPLLHKQRMFTGCQLYCYLVKYHFLDSERRSP